MNTNTSIGPNPRRVEAGRRNRLKQAPLSPEARQRIREATLRNQPWLRSTGPRTEAGKAIVAQNGRKRQKGPLSVRQTRASLFEINAMVIEMADLRQSILGQ